MERSNQAALFRLAALFLVTLSASAALQFDSAVAQTAIAAEDRAQGAKRLAFRL
jgi:hypothetical protein